MSDDLMGISRARALAIFTGQMSAMIDVGVCLGSIMEVLSERAPSPYGEFCRLVPARWEENDHLPFSAIMEETPELFPDFYIKTVKCGEIGGMLEVSFGDLSELLEETLRMWEKNGRPTEWISLLLSPDQSGPRDWAELGPLEQKLILMLYCRSLGAMLASGVPIILAGDTAAGFLPAVQRKAFRAVYERRLGSGGRLSEILAGLGLGDAFLTLMVKIGEEGGNLDAVLQKAADTYQRELEIGC